MEIFGFFTDVAIIAQLASALFRRTLPHGMHPSHFAILNHLTLRQDGKEPARIAEAMQVTKATMTHSLRLLEERALIRTEPHATDSRAKRVYLTDAGRAFRLEAIAKTTALFEKIFDADTRRLLKDLHPGLRAIREILDDKRDP